MTEAQKLIDLAKHCEEATGPDRSIDGMIAHAIGCTMPDDPDGWPPRYTGSLDAAVSLVPEGAGLIISRHWIRRGEAWSVSLGTGGVPSNPRLEFVSEDAPSGPLAIVSPALRARASSLRQD